jgi:hypothetical protein
MRGFNKKAVHNFSISPPLVGTSFRASVEFADISSTTVQLKIYFPKNVCVIHNLGGLFAKRLQQRIMRCCPFWVKLMCEKEAYRKRQCGVVPQNSFKCK